MRILAIPAVVFAAVLAFAAPVSESEPNGFTSPPPQPLGLLGAGGFQVSGSLDPTSPTGLDPGDRDGYSFLLEAAGPLSATVDDGGAGEVFLLALSVEEDGGPSLLAAVTGPAPLTLARPSLATGLTYRVGVAALSAGDPLPYTLDIRPVDSLPPWSGASCTGALPEAEPDGDAATATDLGDFTGILCGAGSVAEVAPPGSETPGDVDFFRFRDVLPVPARLVFTADPGTVRVTVYSLQFVGIAPLREDTFGSVREIDLPPLEPGMTYYVAVSAEQGTAPLAYSFHLEPIAPPPPPPPEPLEIVKGWVRFTPVPSFKLKGEFEPGLGGTLPAGVPFTYRVRGCEESFPTDLLLAKRRGRLVYRGPKGVPGLRSLVLDPVRGRITMRGKGLEVQTNDDPLDPTLEVELDFDGLRFAAEEECLFTLDRALLKVPKAID